jgi:hypothetical protein
MNSKNDIFDSIRQFFTENPKYFGLFIVAVGVLFLLAAIKNWNWFFEGRSLNLNKIEGISNFFGRRFARIVAGTGGISCIVAGIVWFLLG